MGQQNQKQQSTVELELGEKTVITNIYIYTINAKQPNNLGRKDF